MLAVEIEVILEWSDRTWAHPGVHRWLCRQGFRVGRKRVARIMVANGWEGESVEAGVGDEFTDLVPVGGQVAFDEGD